MKYSTAWLVCLALSLVACTKSNFSDRKIAFVAKKATEAELKFSHEVEIESSKKPSQLEALEQVEHQVQHLFGPMERADTTSAPKEDHSIRITSIRPKEDVPGIFIISYDYRGTIVVEKGPKKYLTLTMPINPKTIYQDAMVGDHNPCTDDHYQGEGDFWYFWSPAPIYPSCKLEKGKHYQEIQANIERIPPDAKATYPEYHRLAKDGVIDFHLFFGMDEPGGSSDPARSRDINAENYRKTKEDLERLGFTVRKWSESEIRKIAIERGRLPFVEEAVKDFARKKLKLRVRLFFGETGIDENSAAFHYFLRDSMTNSSVMVYDGHSGLGGHLNLAAISKERGFRLSPNKNRYQIFFFNSCTSYTYYNTLYFQRKRKGGRGQNLDPKGTKQLDILANGLSTSFDVMHNTDMSLVNAVSSWAQRGTWISYQRLAREIDSDNLFTVNGDEDNPKAPVRE